MARAVNAEPLSVPSFSVPGAMCWSATACSITVMASLARQRSDSCQPTISRVQQSMIAFRYTHPCSATQIEVMSRCHRLPGTLDAEKPRPPPARLHAAALDQPALAHDA